MAVTMKVEKITPTKAKSLLELNTHNRKPRERKIQQMASDMRSGKWRLTGESIKLGQNGKGSLILIDGQNRLMAVARANVTVEMPVVRGLDYGVVMPVIDSGTSRTMSDVFKLNGEMNYALLSAITTLAYRQNVRRMRDASFSASHLELLEFLGENPELRGIATWVSSCKFPLMTSSAGAAMFFGRQVDEATTDRFFESVRNGEGLTRGQPAHTFRSWVVNARASTRRPPPMLWSAVTNRALVAELEGRELRVLKWSPASVFPYVQDAEVISSDA